MAATPIVELGPGSTLRGKTVFTSELPEKPVECFLGVPYAKPPLGELRFKPPQPADLWPGERDAVSFGAVCPQPFGMTEKAFPRFLVPNNPSEDCLFLNVWTPTSNPEAKLPVMVWIHGGGFLLGSSDCYDGAPLAAMKDIVFVSLNYRLGTFGFLATPDGHITGNMGLMDQVEALRWVQKYIKRFGGDPTNVTVFGESAGAISASLHTLSPMARGLFRRVICQSGMALYTGVIWTKENCAKFLSSRLGKAGCNAESGQEIETFLRSLSTEQVMEAIPDMAARVIDGSYLPAHPYELYRSDLVAPVEILAGFNTDEGYLFSSMFAGESGLPDKDTAKALITTVLSTVHFRGNPNLAQIAQTVNERYLKNCRDTPDEITRSWSDIQADAQFIAPTMGSLGRHVDRAKTYLYYFTHRPFFSTSASWVISNHTDDIPYTLGEPFSMSRRPAHEWPAADRAVSRILMDYWVNFARTGDPNGDGLAEWPQYTKEDGRYLVLSEQPRVQQHYRPDDMNFWLDDIPKVAKLNFALNHKL